MKSMVIEAGVLIMNDEGVKLQGEISCSQIQDLDIHFSYEIS
ncbi:hypothetical protein [Clostridium saccharoperbutylacetonicum]|jgi:hypothetical protein